MIWKMWKNWNFKHYRWLNAWPYFINLIVCVLCLFYILVDTRENAEYMKRDICRIIYNWKLEITQICLHWRKDNLLCIHIWKTLLCSSENEWATICNVTKWKSIRGYIQNYILVKLRNKTKQKLNNKLFF